MDKLENLSQMELDALKELGSIGAGNAATALSTMLSKRIDLIVPEVGIYPIEEIPDKLGGPEVVKIGVYFTISGDTSGSMLLMLEKDEGLKLVKIMLGPSYKVTGELDLISKSALEEIANILVGSYLSAFSQFTHMRLMQSTPAFAYDMCGSIIDMICIQLAQKTTHILMVKTEFLEKDDKIRANLFFLPEPAALISLIKSLGVPDYEEGTD
ncbi:chemotaxis protein CheC [Candidatus Dependentiae bacterium]|nr:chemotaxis protein CheC [Candidatus Dependentiae bacterium]